MSKKVLFPGSFNPFTIGHADIVERGLALFDRVVIAVGYNEQKAAATVPSDFVGGKMPADSVGGKMLADSVGGKMLADSVGGEIPADSVGGKMPGEMPAGTNPTEIETRLEAIRNLYRDEPRVSVISYSCLTVDAAKEHGACAILRSVRSVKDYEYELQMADVNRRLTGIETVVLFARPELASISSSVVRELQHFGCDVTEFLP